MSAPGKGLIFGGTVTGAGLVFIALGLAPATQEALPFGIGIFIFGLLFAVPGFRAFRRRHAVERAAMAGVARGEGPTGPPSTVECPNCRGPAPLCLFKPTTSTCVWCHQQFELPPELSRTLSAGAAAVKAQSDAERHIAKSVEALALREASWLGTMRKLALVLLGVAVLVGLWAFLSRNTNHHWHAWLFNALVSGALAVWLSAQLRTRVPAAVQRIIGRWTALQLPNAEGLACRVCGGPLPGEAKPVLRCTYCSADNLAGQGVLARVAAGAAHAQAGALAVGQRRQQGEELLAFALNAYVPATLVGWFAIGAFAGSGFLTLGGDLRMWVDSSARFALVRVQHGNSARPCVAVMRDQSGGVRLSFDAWRTMVVTADQLARVSVSEPVAPSWFEGKSISGEGKVVQVVRYLRWPDRHMLRLENDAWDHYLPSNFGGGGLTCLDEELEGEALELPPKKDP
jgi:hypothetical protein